MPLDLLNPALTTGQSADWSMMPATPQQEQSREVHGLQRTPTPVKEERKEVGTQVATARLRQLADKIASSGQQSSACGDCVVAELASLRQAGNKAQDILQAACSALSAQSAACRAWPQRQRAGTTAMPDVALPLASSGAAATADAVTAALDEAAAAQQALEKAEKELAVVKRERDQLSSHLAAARTAEALARKELRCVQRDMQRMVAAVAEGSLTVWQGSCGGEQQEGTPLPVLLAWEVQRLEEENQVLLGQVEEMQGQLAAERALGSSPQKQHRTQYLEKVRLERDQLRQECDAALKQRFQLEQCIRFLAAKANMPVAVRLAATGRPRQDPLAAVLPVSLAECRAAARPVSPQLTSQQPCSEGRGSSQIHGKELSRGEKAGEPRAPTGDSVTGDCGASATEPSTSSHPAEASPCSSPDSTSCDDAEGQACNSKCEHGAVPIEGLWAKSRASAAAKQLEVKLLEQVAIVCARV